MKRDRLALALQGGGSHGAYSWGVLDALLEQGLRFESVCGVSSGAILATMAVQGMVHGGTAGARAQMARFWDRVAASDWFGPMMGALDRWLPGFEIGRGMSNAFAIQGLSAMSSLFGPLSVNPLGQNPLRPILADLLDRSALADPSAPALFVAATAVETGQVRIFANAAITVDALLASACLPTAFPAVMIEGKAYWDGAYSGNPPLAPLLARRPERLVLIRAQSRLRKGVPEQPADIFNRVQEMAFQATIEAELTRLPAETRLIEYDADRALDGLTAESRASAERVFLDKLFRAGRAAGQNSPHGD